MKLWSSLATLVVLAGCNTVQGLGEDLQEGGVAIEEAAQAAQYEDPQPVYRKPTPAPEPVYRRPPTEPVYRQQPVNPAYY